jgi:hypothetical protein
MCGLDCRTHALDILKDLFCCLMQQRATRTALMVAHESSIKSRCEQPHSGFELLVETVADTWNGEDEARPLGNRLDFLAQLRDIHV